MFWVGDGFNVLMLLWIFYVFILLYLEFLIGIVNGIVVVVRIFELEFGCGVGVFIVLGVGVNL